MLFLSRLFLTSFSCSLHPHRHLLPPPPSVRSNSTFFLLHSSRVASSSSSTPPTAHVQFTPLPHSPYDFASHLHCPASLLQDAGTDKDTNRGKSLHCAYFKLGLSRYPFIQNNLLKMYGDFGHLADARLAFDEMLEPNLVSWTSMISSYIQNGCAESGLHHFWLMCRSGLRPNEFGFSSAVKACSILGDLKTGKLLHGYLLKCGYERCTFCNTAIMGLYTKSGILDDACQLLDENQPNSEASWNTLIDAYAKNFDSGAAVELFHRMLTCDILPSCFTYSILIKLSADVLSIDLGQFLHARAIKSGFEKSIYLGSALVDLYAKGGFLSDACRVFWSLEERDNVVWSTLLVGFRQNGEPKMGLNYSKKFISMGYKLDPYMFVTLFNLCSDLECPVIGSQSHCSFAKSGFILDAFVGSAIIDMYCCFGMTLDAYNCFVRISDKNEIVFDVMILAFASCSDDKSTIRLFSKMRREGLMPAASTLNCVVSACINLYMLEEAKVVQSYILKTFGESNVETGNCLIEMYAKYGNFDEAAKLFNVISECNEFSWTNMILAYYESDKFEEALGLFCNMNSMTYIRPSQYTMVVALQACSRLESLDQGKQIHSYAIKSGCGSHVFIGTALLCMYTECGSMKDASQVFMNMSERDAASWSAIIAANTHYGFPEEAIKLFLEYKSEYFSVDEIISAACLAACSSLIALDKGKWIHAIVIKNGFESHLHVGGAIIHMYCKCGSIGGAQIFFEKMTERSVVSWTAMVCGYAQHGLGVEALNLFDQMKMAGVAPDGVTFIGVLSACSHVGYVREGWHYFETMKSEHGLERTIYHYACMVDLLGRAGQLEEAKTLIQNAHFSSKNILWKTLLGACGKHANADIGSQIAGMLVESEPTEPSNYVVLSNIYSTVSMWDRSSDVRNKMKGGHMNKQPGCSWIEVAV